MNNAQTISKANVSSLRYKYIILVCSIFFGLLWLYPRVQLLIAPVYDQTLLDSFALPISYFSAALLGVHILALVSLVRGILYARIVVVATLFVMLMMTIIDSVAFFRYSFETFGLAGFLQSPKNLWELTTVPRWLIWFSFSYWFFILKNKNIR